MRDYSLRDAVSLITDNIWSLGNAISNYIQTNLDSNVNIYGGMQNVSAISRSVTKLTINGDYTQLQCIV